MTPRPEDYRAVVHPERRKTRVFLVAGTPPCIQLRDEAARPKGRDDHTALLGKLGPLQPPKRWVLAAILCPGETTDALVAWLREHDADAGRIMLVLHPDTDPVDALRAWYAAGLGDPVAIEARSLKALAKPLGQFVNDWIYVDAKGVGWPL